MDARFSQGLVIALQKVPLSRVQIFGLEEDAILWSELDLSLTIRLRKRNLIIRTPAIVIEDVGIQRVAYIAKNAILRSGFVYLPAAKVTRGRADAETIGLESFEYSCSETN